MNTLSKNEAIIRYSARPERANRQDTLPSRYRGWVMILSLAAFSLAFAGWLNESWLYLFESPIWLNRYTEYMIILAFGLWRIHAERNPYTRRRLIILVAVVTGFWWLVPWLNPVYEPYVGYVWFQPVFPSLHTSGTLTFFLALFLVLLFGRRVICGFGCPCVGIRETVGFPFRRKTLRGPWAWRFRHTKWVFFIWYVGVMVATQFPPSAWTVGLVGSFSLVVGLTYFGSFFIIPITGNRFYCRYLCPYGATFGLLNYAGFYRIKMNTERCIDCHRCEQACDMGIPVRSQGKTYGQVTGLEDCMGCARCVISCPTDALAIHDVRNFLRPTLRQDASYLLKISVRSAEPREEPPQRPPEQRRADWAEPGLTPDLAAMSAQAARCLDCGLPRCRNACPLGNPIPDWLEAAAAGDMTRAGELVHSRSPLPEVCGRICPQHRLCEGACTRGRLEGAVTIGALERSLADAALAGGWRPTVPKPHNGRRVAIIGAGPAGIACAERLNREGVEVSIYERANQIGGLLYTGVPSFKLPKALLERRRKLLEQAGILFRLGIDVDADQFAALLDAYDAVFLATGAQKPRNVNLTGQALVGVENALPWLAAVNHGQGGDLRGEQLLVLGGGDTAMDCARSALRLGAELTVAYRSPETRLRASPKEVTLAREEGVKFLFEHRPLACEGEVDVAAVRFATPEGETSIMAERVILAFGQQSDPPPWLAALGVETELDGRIRIDTRGATTRSKIWAGGDNTHGPDLAVTALAAGRRAAEGMLKDFHGLSRFGVNHGLQVRHQDWLGACRT